MPRFASSIGSLPRWWHLPSPCSGCSLSIRFWDRSGSACTAPSPGCPLAAIIGADVWKATPVAALILLAGLQTIPSELEEAAAVDGAGRIARFLRVTLPLLRPALLVVILFRTIDAFRVFDLAFVMTEGG